MTLRRAVGSFGVAACLSLFVSCPNPIPSDLAAQISDHAAPVITIAEPSDRSEYGTVIRVIGTALEGDGSEPARVSECTYEIEGSVVAGEFSVDEVGRFDFYIVTTESDGTSLVDGTITVAVQIVDWSGNTACETVELIPGATGDVPGFEVVPSSRSVTISWSSVPGATAYDVVEYKYGQTRSDVTSPYTWEDLSNGDTYRFQVRASIPDELAADAYSSVEVTVPASTRTFAPRVMAVDDSSITMAWWDSPGLSEYIVERRLSVDSPWEVRRSLAASGFTDEDLSMDTRYHYRVTPVGHLEIPSHSVAGSPSGFTSELAWFTGAGLLVQAHSVAIAGSHLIVCAFDQGLWAIDITTPTNPGAPTKLLDVYACDVEVIDGYAYVAAWDDGIAILDVEDLAAPVTPGYLSLPELAHTVEVGDGYLFALSSSDIATIDISVPGDAEVLDFYGSGNGSGDLAYSDGHLYVSATLDAVSVYEVGGTGTLSWVDVATIDPAVSRILVANNHLYATRWDPQNGTSGLAVVDVTDPADLGTPAYLSMTERPTAITSDGDRLHVGTESGDISVYDISDPAAPVEVSHRAVAAECESICVAGDYAFVGTNLGGVGAVRLGNPLTAGALTSTPALGRARDVVLAGDFAYVCCMDTADAGWLAVYDVSDPLNPSDPVHLSLNGQPSAVEVSGETAFLACGLSGLALIDVSDPLSPGDPTYVECSFAVDVDIAGDYAYVADHNSGLAVVAIDDSSAPTLVSRRDTRGTATGVAVADAIAYLACGNDGIAIIDLSDPRDPGTPQYRNDWAGAYALRLACTGSHLFVSTNDGLGVLDIGDPANPTSIPALLPDVGSGGIAVAGIYAFVASHDSGLAVVDVADSMRPFEVMFADTTADAFGVAVRGRHAYVAASEAGLAVVEFVEQL